MCTWLQRAILKLQHKPDHEREVASINASVTLSEATRQASELILSDERLASNLEDAEAEVLLHWANSVAMQAAADVVASGRASNREAVADAVGRVRQIARTISGLVARYSESDRREVLDRLLALVEMGRQLGAGATVPAAGTHCAEH